MNSNLALATVSVSLRDVYEIHVSVSAVGRY
jgi:hypothetical protein